MCSQVSWAEAWCPSSIVAPQATLVDTLRFHEEPQRRPSFAKIKRTSMPVIWWFQNNQHSLNFLPVTIVQEAQVPPRKRNHLGLWCAGEKSPVISTICVILCDGFINQSFLVRATVRLWRCASAVRRWATGVTYRVTGESWCVKLWQRLHSEPREEAASWRPKEIRKLWKWMCDQLRRLSGETKSYSEKTREAPKKKTQNFASARENTTMINVTMTVRTLTQRKKEYLCLISCLVNWASLKSTLCAFLFSVDCRLGKGNRTEVTEKPSILQGAAELLTALDCVGTIGFILSSAVRLELQSTQNNRMRQLHVDRRGENPIQINFLQRIHDDIHKPDAASVEWGFWSRNLRILSLNSLNFKTSSSVQRCYWWRFWLWNFWIRQTSMELTFNKPASNRGGLRSQTTSTNQAMKGNTRTTRELTESPVNPRRLVSIESVNRY